MLQSLHRSEVQTSILLQSFLWTWQCRSSSGVLRCQHRVLDHAEGATGAATLPGRIKLLLPKGVIASRLGLGLCSGVRRYDPVLGRSSRSRPRHVETKSVLVADLQSLKKPQLDITGFRCCRARRLSTGPAVLAVSKGPQGQFRTVGGIVLTLIFLKTSKHCSRTCLLVPFIRAAWLWPSRFRPASAGRSQSPLNFRARKEAT